MFTEDDIAAANAAGREWLTASGYGSYVSDEKLAEFVKAVLDAVEEGRAKE